MATELAKAYVQIIPSADGIKGKISKIVDPEAEEAGKSAGSKLTSGLSGMLGGAAKIAGAAVAATAAGVAALAKTAVDSYADYEQLVGGVETLFKENASTVTKYADEAFKTAGLSANEYMETVTGFSASLLQGLGGDTAKAAEVANRAVVDMSDNANKMGTSIESIQNAYQGFAKQNYTMLDNLKLGYGGTKSEMERLIADASKMTSEMSALGVTVDADSMSFDNIINAISVMQEHLGIAGTTSKEASTTISGSIGMMKSAWSNLLTGIADDSADFDKLINNLVESVDTVGQNIMPRVEIALNGIAKLIGSLAPMIIKKIPELVSSLLPKLLDAVSTIAKSISAVLPNAISTLVSVIVSNLPMVLKAGIDILMSLIKGITQSIPQLIGPTIDAILQIVDTLIDNIDFLVDAGIELIIGLTEGLIEATPKIIDKIPEIVIKITEAFIRNAPKILEAAIQLMVSLANGLISSAGKVYSLIPQIISTIADTFVKRKDELKNVGMHLIDGLWQGIKSVWNNLVTNVTNLGKNLVSSVKNIFGIHSPSKVFAEIGEYCVMGFDNSFDNFGTEAIAKVDSVVGEMEEMGNSFDVTASNISSSAANSARQGLSYQDNSAEMLALLSQYLPELGKDTQTNVTLQGDASNIFRVVRNEVNKFSRSTGYSPFSMA